MSDETTEASAEEAETYNLVFFPQLEDGADFEEVKEKLSATLKVDQVKVDGWYDAEEPTVLLKGVAKDVAERYMDAILKCGAVCNIQASSDVGALSLVPKSAKVDFFICPSCEYEEEVPQGTSYEQCPKCGLVIAKWEEKMREEAEKEKIRRRLMRDARLEGDREEDLARKREELERLRALELEIMKELGLKTPSRFWRFFERYPISVSSAFAMLIVAASGLVLHQVDQYLDAQAVDAVRASAAPAEVQAIAPVISAAVQLQQNGNQAMISEIAEVTTKMHGSAPVSQQELIGVAQQMMKGVDADQFVASASKNATPGMMTRAGPDGQEPVRFNTDTVGGVTGIPGVEKFDARVLQSMAPPLLEHGHENVLTVLTERVSVPDPLNLDEMLLVRQVEDMDGSMIVDLMKGLATDKEWDQYIAQNVRVFIADGQMDQASELIDRIKNPVTKIASLGEYMVAMLVADPAAALKLPMARVSNELNEIADPDTKASTLLALGRQLAAAGYGAQPDESYSRVNELVRDADNAFEKSYLSARLAVAWHESGNIARAKSLMRTAVNQASQITDPRERISAFTRISQRYYDVRNPTLANEILSEAQVLAASRLEPAERSRVFGEIAIAQGYMGDIRGALLSIDNAAVGEGKQQVLMKLAESLIGLGRYYEAQAVMDEMDDPTGFNRLQIRLITALHYGGYADQVRLRMDSALERANEIEDRAQRSIILSQLGRLARRSGFEDLAIMFFDEALMVTGPLRDRELAVSLGLLALEQARALMPYSSQETMYEVEEAIVQDPISTEIMATERIVQNFMPASVKELIEPEPEY